MHLRTILLIGPAALTLSACGKTPIHDTTPSKRTSKGFDLTVKEDSILLPLEYMEGIDGLMKRKAFDGIYGVVNGGPGYVSREDLSREDWKSTFPEHQTSGEVFVYGTSVNSVESMLYYPYKKPIRETEDFEL